MQLVFIYIYDIFCFYIWYFIYQGEEEDEEVKETEEDQDGFFVPHGYLSDDEGVPDDDEESDNEENEAADTRPVSKEVADAKRVWIYLTFAKIITLCWQLFYSFCS